MVNSIIQQIKKGCELNISGIAKNGRQIHYSIRISEEENVKPYEFEVYSHRNHIVSFSKKELQNFLNDLPNSYYNFSLQFMDNGHYDKLMSQALA